MRAPAGVQVTKRASAPSVDSGRPFTRDLAAMVCARRRIVGDIVLARATSPGTWAVPSRLGRHFVQRLVPGELARGGEGVAAQSMDLDRPKFLCARRDSRLGRPLAVHEYRKRRERRQDADRKDCYHPCEVKRVAHGLYVP